MCVVSIALNAHPRWRLLAAGNRDEFHSRLSSALARWNELPEIMAGRDLISGGTWIGASDAGRFAVVTNIRSPDGTDPKKAPRGVLVADWLEAGTLPEALDGFNPFNLIVADDSGLHYLANRPTPLRIAMAPGIHGLSNAVADEHWPRKDRLNALLKGWLGGPANEPSQLLDALSGRVVAARDVLPIFFQNGVYGTRCSTVVAIEGSGRGKIFERRFKASGVISGETALDFQVRK